MFWDPFPSAISATSIHLPGAVFFGFRETADHGGSGPADVEQPLVSGKFVSTGWLQSQLEVVLCRKQREKTVATKANEGWHSYSLIHNNIYHIFDWKWDRVMNISTITHEINTRSSWQLLAIRWLSRCLPYIPRVHLSEVSLVRSSLWWLCSEEPVVLYSEVHLVRRLLFSEDFIFRKALHYMDSMLRSFFSPKFI